MEEYEMFGSVDAFWDAHTNEHGNRLGYTQILHVLKGKRKASYVNTYTTDADAARTFFEGDLGRPEAKGAFSYRKSNVVKVYTSDEKIALSWRNLLEEDEEIRLQWEQRQQASA